MVRTSYISMSWWWWCLLCTRTNTLRDVVLAHRNNYPQVDMSCSLMLHAFWRSSINNNLTVFGLTRPGLEPEIYHTRGEHINHCITDLSYF